MNRTMPRSARSVQRLSLRRPCRTAATLVYDASGYVDTSRPLVAPQQPVVRVRADENLSTVFRSDDLELALQTFHTARSSPCFIGLFPFAPKWRVANFH